MSAHRGLQRLPDRTVARMFRLVDGGMSYRRVAKRLGCHYNTVYRRMKARELGRRNGIDGGAVGRCGGCGDHVRLPCVRCAGEFVAKHRRRQALVGRR